MNLTVLSLISPILLSHSPAFTNNRLTMFDSKFNKFTNVIFYNPKTLLLEKSQFSNGLNSILYKTDSSDDQKIYQNKAFVNFDYTINKELRDIRNKAISIIDCSFTDINTVSSNPDSPILIDNPTVSLYMTQNLFKTCDSVEGVIVLKGCRCITITHTCSYQSKCSRNAAFLYNDGKEEDFSINIYNTIVDSQSRDNEFNVWYSQFGNQYFHCNNITKFSSGGLQLQNPQCLSFKFNNIADASTYCFRFTGYGTECSRITPKTIENSNFFSNSNLVIKIEIPCPTNITIINSVLFAGNQNGQLISYSDNNEAKAVLIKCVISEYLSNNFYTQSVIITRDVSNYLTIHPHYTDGKYCNGPTKNTYSTEAYACNVGDCLSKEVCNKTIGFPEGVPQYKTLVHTDIQPPTPTPTAIFTYSDAFTKSDAFPASEKFTKSDAFKKTDEFTKSNTFTSSDPFTESSPFTESNTFTRSNVFTDSIHFSPTKIFGAAPNENNNKAKMIGIIAGSVGGAAAVAAAAVAIFLIKRPKVPQVQDLDTIDGKETTFSVNNDLQNIMDQDDPFADEFANH